MSRVTWLNIERRSRQRASSRQSLTLTFLYRTFCWSSRSSCSSSWRLLTMYCKSRIISFSRTENFSFLFFCKANRRTSIKLIFRIGSIITAMINLKKIIAFITERPTININRVSIYFDVNNFSCIGNN